MARRHGRLGVPEDPERRTAGGSPDRDGLVVGVDVHDARRLDAEEPGERSLTEERTGPPPDVARRDRRVEHETSRGEASHRGEEPPVARRGDRDVEATRDEVRDQLQDVSLPAAVHRIEQRDQQHTWPAHGPGPDRVDVGGGQGGSLR